MKLAFIIKGLLKNKKKLVQELKGEFPGCVILETAFAFHAADLAKEAADDFSHLIAVGGDGTLSEVVNGLMISDKKDLPVLGLLPQGTANDFAKSVKLNGSLMQLKSLLQKNSHKKIDIGKVSFTGIDNNPAERYFINIADIGIGGCIVEAINKGNKRLGANATFFLETLKAMFTYKRSEVKFVSDEFSWQGKTLSMVIANGRYFGSGLCIAPDAILDDGKFNVVILGDVTVLDYLRNLNGVKKGIKIKNPEVYYRESSSVNISPVEAPCPIDMDGEFIGYAPAKFEIMPGRVSFLMP